MIDINEEIMKCHIKTHTEHSAEDDAAVTMLKSFLLSGGRINTKFDYNDKWPNTDGTFELVPNPTVSRRPEQSFFVQIKGIHSQDDNDSGFKYSLKNLAFPAFIGSDCTLDPGILFVVVNPDIRGSEKVFWKYMSVDFINSLDFNKKSTTISFSRDDEIINTDEGVMNFCKKLEKIIEHHLFINRLSKNKFTIEDVKKIVDQCNTEIVESIDRFEILNDTRDNVSRRILARLNDLCTATLLLNCFYEGFKLVDLQLAWERAILNVNTKYLSSFLKELKYLDGRIPDEGQSERLLLRYYNFMWQIRKNLFEQFKLTILPNLEKFPLKIDEVDKDYYELIANAIENTNLSKRELRKSRFYVHKKTPFFVGTERYYEITLQLAGAYATKYNIQIEKHNDMMDLTKLNIANKDYKYFESYLYSSPESYYYFATAINMVTKL